ncbi:MAG TPA: LysM peptidoglycan-binding domain-containing protein [Acidiferrobacter sp.]|nr:LysM peptidoglycan-binding domain-containing protein [Acidiferrobacter sp.]
MRRLCLSICLLAVFTAHASADRLIMPHTPRQYIVRTGDTLWGIANHFFRDPWRWPGIWNRNRQIRNPNLIYPGDTIALRYAKGRPYLVDLSPSPVVGPTQGASAGQTSAGTTVLRPSVRSEPLLVPIPTLSPNVIAPLLQRALALSGRDFQRLGYVAASVHHHTFFGAPSLFYARHLGAHPAKAYDIYRQGPALVDANGDFLAYEAIYIGHAKLVRPGRLPELEVTSSDREVESGDRLMRWRPAPPIPYYFPRAPSQSLNAVVVAATHSEINLGTYAALAISIGKASGVRQGYVLRIYSRPQDFYDPVAKENVLGRRQPIGLLMIFKVYDKVSYGIVMQSRREIHVGDLVATP